MPDAAVRHARPSLAFVTGVGRSGEARTRRRGPRRGAVPSPSRAPTEIRSEHAYRFPTTPDVLWSALADVGAYPGWWPWLRAFDARALAAGDVWRCTISPPVPYAIRCDVEFMVVEPTSLVAALVTGDVVGEARLAIGPAPARALVPDVARRGHDWVFAAAARQFGAAHGWPPA